MSSQTPDVTKMVAIYKKLFVLLATITLIGIGIVFLKLPIWIAVVVGLLIMAVKAKIVLDAFGHLLTGRYGLIILFGLTGVFFITLILLPLLNHEGYLVGTVDISKQIQMEAQPAAAHHEAKPAGESNGH